MHAHWKNSDFGWGKTSVCGALGLATVIAQCLPVMAKTPQETMQAEADGGGSATPKPTMRVLLREGSLLIQAVGTISKDADRGAIVFVPMQHPGATKESGGTERVMETVDTANLGMAQLILLPNSVLSEVVRMTESTSGEALTFEVTGEVYVYHQRNYLLAMSAPRLVSTATPSQLTSATNNAGTASDKGASTEPVSQTTQPGGAGMGGDNVEDIKKQLDAAVGAVPTRAGAEDAMSEAEDGLGMSAEEGGGRMQREGTTILSRRGRLSRNAQGAWVFVFDSDGQGLADPPLILMPCQLLERLESYAGRMGNDTRILISGHVTVYGSKNYLLPTAFTIPNERTKIEQ
ncbi:MAG TPA: hypothetical protein VG711_08885 [Phycisphaerales bacterium]|nr:hypothetical protein [Phycisphaerales bacterium]